jgi:hypothetical protein
MAGMSISEGFEFPIPPRSDSLRNRNRTNRPFRATSVESEEGRPLSGRYGSLGKAHTYERRVRPSTPGAKGKKILVVDEESWY